MMPSVNLSLDLGLSGKGQFHWNQGLELPRQYGFPAGLGRLRITPALENVL